MARGLTRLEAEPGLARLWAPWRAGYVLRAGSTTRGCIFCIGTLTPNDRKRRLVLYTSAVATVMLNRYPYSNGHLLIAPRRHRASLEALSPAERQVMSELMAASVGILKRALRPDGFNLGMNLGKMAGAGIAAHAHWHVVPRWAGDSNFMPVLAATRVLSEHLDASFKRLEPLFRKLGPALS